MNEQQYEIIKAIERSGAHVGSGMSVEDYFMLHGTGEDQRRQDERAQWNRRVEAKKAARKAKKARAPEEPWQ